MRRSDKQYKEWIGDWDRFEEIATHWEEMHRKEGLYGMAGKVIKTKSWEAYDRRWPFDNMARWEDNVDILDFTAESNLPSVEDEVAERLLSAELTRYLTPNQREIYEALRQGKTSVQIEKEQGYNTNAAVRWHKHGIKKKYTALKSEQYEKIFEFVCRDCGNVFKGTKIESPCTSCDSEDTLFTKQYFKPIFSAH